MPRERIDPVPLLVTATALVLASGCGPAPGEDGPEASRGAARSDRARDSAGSDAGEGRSDPELPAPRVSWGGPLEVASGGGRVGPWRMNRSDWRYVDDPAVALSADGVATVAWVDQSRKDVFLQRLGPGGEELLPAPANVSRSPGVFSWLPRIVLAPGDPPHVYLLWQEIVFSGGTHGGEAFFARSTDGGRTFEEPLNLSETPAGDGKGRLTRRRWDNGSLDLGRGPAGELYAAWTAYEGQLWVARSTDDGASFSEPVKVAGGGEASPARGPSLAVAADGTVHLAWTAGEDQEADIRVTSSDDGGRSFGDPRVAVETGGHSDAPALAVDGQGRLHLAWGESPRGPLERYHVRYARASPETGQFGASRRLPSPEGDRFEAAHAPSLALDDGGRLYLVWELYPEADGRRRGLGFSASADGGATFSDPAVVPGTAAPELGINGSLQGLFARKLAAGEAGEVAVVNSSFLPRRSSRVRLVRGTLRKANSRRGESDGR